VDRDATETLFVVVDRPAAIGAVQALCGRVHAALSAMDVRMLVCDVSALEDADELALEAVARLQLTAKRAHASMRLVGVGSCLDALLVGAGFADVIDAWRSGPAVHGHAEQREQRRVDEEVDTGDLPV
jgi:NAD(P)-dependent dehydrogenase (short-subunit alcohol dehydrogenase family)